MSSPALCMDGKSQIFKVLSWFSHKTLPIRNDEHRMNNVAFEVVSKRRGASSHFISAVS